MGEPITLYGKTGDEVTAYGPAQAIELYAAGYRPEPPQIALEPEQPKVAPETPAPPPPRIAKKGRKL
jgi:hypothetical protein